jgi:pimeloyl-ACP methyl ester carboxylesterase
MGSTVTVNGGQRLHFVDYGGAGTPVVLLHAFLMDLEMFAPQVAALGGEFRLIAVDERGHGGTPADRPFDYWDVASDVLALLDQLGITRAAVVGTSAAAEDAKIAAGYRELASSWAASGPADQLVDMIAAICLGDTEAEAWKAKWRAVPADRLSRIMETLVDRDGLLTRLGDVHCPVLALHGSADAAYTVCRGAEIVEGAPHAEPLVVVDGGAHFLSLTDADAVNPHLRKFLADNS